MIIKNSIGKDIYVIDADTLRGADLSGAYLANVNLSDVDLSGAIFYGYRLVEIDYD